MLWDESLPIEAGFARLSTGSQPPGEITGTSELRFELGGGALQSYGDRISAATMGTFTYGGEPAFTPNIVTSYHNQPRTWLDGYGDLDNVAPAQAQTITVRIDATNLGNNSQSIGIDNIRFGQVAE